MKYVGFLLTWRIVTAFSVTNFKANMQSVLQMQLLLSRGANVERCNEVGMTALMHACRNGHIEAVEFLLMHNADRFRTTYVILFDFIDLLC